MDVEKELVTLIKEHSVQNTKIIERLDRIGSGIDKGFDRISSGNEKGFERVERGFEKGFDRTNRILKEDVAKPIKGLEILAVKIKSDYRLFTVLMLVAIGILTGILLK